MALDIVARGIGSNATVGVEQVLQMISGAAEAHIFDTVADLDEWLSDPTHRGECVAGYTIFFIREPQEDEQHAYWWDGNNRLPLPNVQIDLSKYATIVQLAQKESLSNKTLVLSELSTDDEYPSAKTVYEALLRHDSIRIPDDYNLDILDEDGIYLVKMTQGTIQGENILYVMGNGLYQTVINNNGDSGIISYNRNFNGMLWSAWHIDGVLSECNYSVIEKEKLDNIESGAQQNLVEIIKIDEQILPIDTSDKSVTIPIASTVLSGLVKSSNQNNGVLVKPDGFMEVNNINLTKVYQDTGDLLILSCGAADN